MHWIGAQFCVCMIILCLYDPGFQRQVFKHVQILSKQYKKKKKKENKEHPCCGIPLQFTKSTIWPRSVGNRQNGSKFSANCRFTICRRLTCASFGKSQITKNIAENYRKGVNERKETEKNVFFDKISTFELHR